MWKGTVINNDGGVYHTPPLYIITAVSESVGQRLAVYLSLTAL